MDRLQSTLIDTIEDGRDNVEWPPLLQAMRWRRAFHLFFCPMPFFPLY
jgi:hypothetical protein